MNTELPAIFIIDSGDCLSQLVASRLEKCGLRVATVTRHDWPEQISNAHKQWVICLWDPLPEPGNTDPGLSREIILQAESLKEFCLETGAALIYLSNGYIFSGEKKNAYISANPGDALSEYGQAKWQAEEILREYPRHIILRTGWRADLMLENFFSRAECEEVVGASSKHEGNPTFAEGIAHAVVAILQQMNCGAEQWGTYQYAETGSVSRYDFLTEVLALLRSRFGRDFHSCLVEDNTALFDGEPLNAALGCIKIRNTFGIKQLPWRQHALAFLESRFGKQKGPDEVEAIDSLTENQNV